MREKIDRLAAMVQEHTQAEMVSKGYTLEVHLPNTLAHVHIGKKFARVDVGTSGKYMVDLATGEIFGIKGYGVVHRGHRYGTLDTIERWYWGGYVAKPIESANIHFRSITDDMTVRDEGNHYTANGRVVFWHGLETIQARAMLKSLTAKGSGVAA